MHQGKGLAVSDPSLRLRAPYLEVACTEEMSHNLFLNELQNNMLSCLNLKGSGKRHTQQ